MRLAVLPFLAPLVLLACSEEPPMDLSKEAAVTAEEAAETPAIDALWNFGDPAGTRAKFIGLLEQEGEEAPLAWQLEVKTQLARTHSLVQEFDEAHSILDEVSEGLTDDMARVRVRYLLERGRAFNSNGEKDEARPLFVEAFNVAETAGEDYLAIDAAHMVAIVDSGKETAKDWALKGLDIARQSTDKRARGWIGSITNNMGWDAFDAGKYEEALALFEESRASFAERGDESRARIARWSIARVWRQQGKIDEALAAQLAMQAEHEEAGTSDAYVHEELGELYWLMGDKEAARPHFAKAFEEISKDPWMVKNEADRLARLKSLSETE